MPDTKTPRDLGPELIPDVLHPSISKAKARTLRRPHGPPVLLERKAGETHWSWPWAEDTERGEDWRWLVLDAFGTRNEAVAAAFLGHLVRLCSSAYDDETQEWVPDQSEIMLLVHIVGAHRPRNEAQAALAAQMAATHILLMKVGKQVADYPYDTRMIGAFSNLAKASAAQFEAMATTKGKRRTARQVIEVKHERHVHQHKHVHFEGGGSDHGDGQPQGTIVGGGLAENGAGAAVPCPDTSGRVVPISGGARSSAMS